MKKNLSPAMFPKNSPVPFLYALLEATRGFPCNIFFSEQFPMKNSQCHTNFVDQLQCLLGVTTLQIFNITVPYAALRLQFFESNNVGTFHVFHRPRRIETVFNRDSPNMTSFLELKTSIRWICLDHPIRGTVDAAILQHPQPPIFPHF